MKLHHFKPGILFLRARVELAAENKDNAHQILCDALALSDGMGAHREVWEICWMLGQLEAKRGNEFAADRLRERARIEIELIAKHAGTPVLREIFLSRPEVQMILDAV